VATHAYTVAPGYAELEQGVRAFGLRKFSEATAWDVNFKIGLSPGVQLGLFGLPYVRSGAGGGMGDVGAALKLSRELSPTAAVAIVPAVTVPTGDNSRGLGAGRTLWGLVGAFSSDLSGGVHFDANAGPVGVGAGKPLWFTSIGLSFGAGSVAVATELFDYTSGAAAPRQRGFLAALLVHVSQSAVLDVGGVRGLVDGTPHEVFVGLTTNLGAIFK